MLADNNSLVHTLLQQGVQMPNPASVTIDPALDPERIAAGALIHGGCRIMGERTSIGPGCILGREAPVTLDNCQLGARVNLAGGYFSEATFLNRASLGSGAHVRAGTLCEEESSTAHAVGLKQTILFPHVALGSLINFCDVLVAGGTSRQNHSEIGSAYVHFNYTPHQDKATASLLGDVPHGVMLDQPPIFLGGQGGLVGPAQVAFGAIVAAGTIVRQDISQAGLFSPPPKPQPPPLPYQPGVYHAINRIISNNLAYIGNLYALRAWYQQVRALFLNGDSFQSACLQGALERLASILQERQQRLQQFAEKIPQSLKLVQATADASKLNAQPFIQQQKLIERWPLIKEQLAQLPETAGHIAQRDQLLAALAKIPANTDYLNAIKSLEPAARAAGTSWLQSIVEAATGLWNKVL